MNFIRLVIQQPVTVAVGVILIVLSGLVALDRIPIQLTPDVEQMVITVSTSWEGASPEEVEKEIIIKQEEKLQGVASVVGMTSQSSQGGGSIRLEFATGTDKAAALQEVSDKLREVRDYPENADQPILATADRENRDYIAWIVFTCTDSSFDVRTLQDFAEDRIKPALERVEGISEINVLGGRERETQVRFDPVRLAQFGITPNQFVTALRSTNRNVSAGELADGKYNVRVRTVSQFESVADVENTVLTYTSAGPVLVRDVATVIETYKEESGFVRSKGRRVIAINAQKEVGSNVMAVMSRYRQAVDKLNAPGGALNIKASQLGLNGTLRLEQVYDQTVYIDQALALVRNNIWLGGGLAVIVLLLFLRSVRSVGIIALAIPISVIGAVVAMVGLGRSVNVISLAGMAFAVGMVVDNAIVVLENIFRHLEMGKGRMQAAYDGTREVWGAVLASTLTTIVVFVPILLIQDEAGQLFRDIALAICAAVALSLLISISVIPTSAARILHASAKQPAERRKQLKMPIFAQILLFPVMIPVWIWKGLNGVPFVVSRAVYLSCGSVLVRVLVIGALTAGSIYGTLALMPPADYLPTGNRNLVFGLMIPPPGHNVKHNQGLADRVEATIRPFWEAGELDPSSDEYKRAAAALRFVPRPFTQGVGPDVQPAPLTNYFMVMFGDIMFQGGVSADPDRVADTVALMQYATRSEVLPGVMSFASQTPLFRLGGSSGSAAKVNLTGDDMSAVSRSAQQLYLELAGKYGFASVQPDPGNFNLRRHELRVVPDKQRLADVQMSPTDLALAVQAVGDGAWVGEYRKGGETIDLKLIAEGSVNQMDLPSVSDVPVATPAGLVVPISSLAKISRVTGPPQINHSGRQRAVTLQVTPPRDVPLQQLIDDIELTVASFREQGRISPDVGVTYSGSASKLTTVKTALLGDGTWLGTLNSSLTLALIVVYLMMCVLFQSFIKPLVIMFSVPLATFGGFAALYAVHVWSVSERYMPEQKLDVLTILGFIILIGVVVNNAILIVHQAGNFMKGAEGESPMSPRDAIAQSVRTRIRPIFMSTLTSLGGLLPLVIMPGSGSELYRGLGAVVLGGLLVSTIFTLFLVPLLLSLSMDLSGLFQRRAEDKAVTIETRHVPLPAPSAMRQSSVRSGGSALPQPAREA